MYTFLRHLRFREALLSEAPALLLSLVIARRLQIPQFHARVRVFFGNVAGARFHPGIRYSPAVG